LNIELQKKKKKQQPDTTASMITTTEASSVIVAFSWRIVDVIDVSVPSVPKAKVLHHGKLAEYLCACQENNNNNNNNDRNRIDITTLNKKRTVVVFNKSKPAFHIASIPLNIIQQTIFFTYNAT
jgi:hypothetical protein